jgi:peroxiredoxin
VAETDATGHRLDGSVLLVPLLLLAAQHPPGPSPSHPLPLGRAPEFSLPSLRELGLIQRTDFAGKVVLLEVWRTDCPRSQREADTIVGLRRKYRERGLEVLGVADENPDPGGDPFQRAMAFAREQGLEHPLAMNDGGEFHAGYYQRARGTPSAYLIRRSGELEFLGLDPASPERREALEALIVRRLDEPAPAALAPPAPLPALPEFTLLALRGGAIRSSELLGKPALIALLSPALTARHGPTLSDLASRYGPLGLRVIGVTFGGFREVIEDADARTPRYEVAFPDADAQRVLVGRDALPKLLFVTAEGKILKTITTVYGKDRDTESAVCERYAAILVGRLADRPSPVAIETSYRHRELGFALDPPRGYRETTAVDGAQALFVGRGSEELRVALERRFESGVDGAERVADAVGEGNEARRIESRFWDEVNGARALRLSESWRSPLGLVRALRLLVPSREGVYVLTASAPDGDFARDRSELERAVLSFRVGPRSGG